MAEACCIAIVGAESTGKTTLAADLAADLAAAGYRATWVPEALRDWCQAQGRTPRADEQDAIARAQHERVMAAAATHEVVVTDTTALMTAVYSELLFGDTRLHALAAQWHRSTVQLTLLTALDLPWVADGHQRDGPQVREPVDRALRALMDRHGIAYTRIDGQGPARLARARAAMTSALAAFARGESLSAGPRPRAVAGGPG